MNTISSPPRAIRIELVFLEKLMKAPEQATTAQNKVRKRPFTVVESKGR